MSQYSRLVQHFWNSSRLFSALLELTYACNLNCAFCYNDRTRTAPLLVRDEWLQLLDELADLGCLHLALSGGEPVASPDFFAIGRRARELGFVIRVKSNGYALSGPLLERLLHELDPYVIEITVHGATAQTHDRQTRVPGSFDRVLENLEQMRALGVRVQLNSTLTIWNEHEIEALFELADRLEARLRVDPEVTPRDDGDRSPGALRASPEGLRRLYEIEARRAGVCLAVAAEGPTGSGGTLEGAPNGGREVGRQADALPMPTPAGRYCGAGSGAVAVDPFGNVYPCVQWRRLLGNFRQQRLREIWERSMEVRKVRELGNRIASRLVGEEAALMSFCPGIAEQLTGDAGRLYPEALARREVARALRRVGEDGARSQAG